MTRTEQRRNKVREEAKTAYESWGQYICECYTDEELDKHISEFVKKLRESWKDYEDYANDIRNS